MVLGISDMAHIHEKIDFTVAIFVVHAGKILLIHHRKLDKWLPLGDFMGGQAGGAGGGGYTHDSGLYDY